MSQGIIFLGWQKVVTTVVSSIGCVANTLSLYFFIRKANHGITNKLFILLGFWDFLNCCTLMGFAWLNTALRWEKVIHHAVNLNASFNMTIVAVTRSIKICFPLYRIKKRWLIVSIALCFLYSVFVRALLDYKALSYQSLEEGSPNPYTSYLYIGSVVFALGLIVSVTLANVLSYIRILRPTHFKVTKSGQEAAKTVLILSLIFLLSTVVLTGIAVRNIFLLVQNNEESAPFQNVEQNAHFFYNLMLVLNSAANPIVLFFRNVKMRGWVTEPLTVRTHENNNDNQNPSMHSQVTARTNATKDANFSIPQETQ